jgi:hypothetical protein
MGNKKGRQPALLLHDLRKAIRGAGPGVRVLVRYVDADGYVYNGYAYAAELGTDVYGHVQLDLSVDESET